ncbi:hypothetical protein O77CONTIG1_04327 [Leptolyngbya sp. O-77]|nr:hypothetical protein O77CONTIG1_04327 [Leptolyngbya sp. O-77]
MACKLRPQDRLHMLMLLCHQGQELLADGFELFLWRAPVERSPIHLCLDLALDARHSHHKKLIQIAAKNRRKLYPLQQGRALVHRLMQHPRIKLNPAQFAAEVVLRI